jgi:L-fuculose-phosphate aldolase
LDGLTVFTPKNKKPTGETPFHTRIMHKHPEIRAIVHAHPPIMTGLAIANSDLLTKPFLPEPIFEVGPMLMIPYGPHVTEALSKQFDLVINKSNGFLMENHRAVICSTNGMFEAVELTQIIEYMAQSVLVSILLGNCKKIPPNYLKELDQVIEMRNLTIDGIVGKFKSLTDSYEIRE